MADGEQVKVGDLVHHWMGDGLDLRKSCGAAKVMAIDAEDPEKNQPSAWLRYTSPEGYHRYRSADVCDLLKATEEAET